MLYTEEEINRLETEFNQIRAKTAEVICEIGKLQLSSDLSKKILTYGFLKRFFTIKFCIEFVFQKTPLRKNNIGKDEKTLLEIIIHSFFINLSGCIDNLAWILFLEKNLILQKDFEKGSQKVNLWNNNLNKKIKIDEFKKFLQSEKIASWRMSYLKNSRDRIAHRIPITIPPAALNQSEMIEYAKIEEKIEKNKTAASQAFKSRDFKAAEDYFDEINDLYLAQESIGIFLPIFHDHDSIRIAYHPQLLADFNTLIEILNFFVLEILQNDTVSS